MAFNTPILLVIFNRPDTTQRVFNRIREIQPKQLFISADGARPHKAGEKEKCQATRAIIEQVDWVCEVKTLFRSENLGCRMAVSGGINWFFEQVEEGIILEDDCLPDLTFFRFCEELLQRYKEDERIYQIGGSNLIQAQFATTQESYLFSNFSLIWGWATWRRAWQQMNVHMPDLEKFKISKKIRDFVPDRTAQQYILQKFDDTYHKRNNSWAYAWIFTVLNQNGLTIIPTKNLIHNIGFGADATNTTSTKETHSQLPASPITFPLVHPTSIEKHDKKVAMEFFYASQKPKLLLWVNKVVPQFLLQFYRKKIKK